MHERNESMVSMKDVAVECGVSIATVSKALNDHSDISEETRRKVKDTLCDYRNGLCCRWISSLL